MDLSQLIIVAVAVAGAVIVGLLAIVPTVLELPRGRESDEPVDAFEPTVLTSRERSGGDHDRKLAA